MTSPRPGFGGAALVAALLLGAPGEARAVSLAAAARPAYCAPLSWVIRTWRGSRAGDPALAPSHALARRLDRVARTAAAAGRSDVARAVDQSARWIVAGDGTQRALGRDYSVTVAPGTPV